MPEQRDAADFILRQGSVALFAQQRTGKTYISMAVLEKRGWPFALIVAPLTSIDVVWIPALKQSGYQICRSLVEVRQAIKALRGAPQKTVLVIHWQLFTKIAKQLAKLPWQDVIIDESQGLKARNSRQSKAARRFRGVPHRLALSGTPIDGGEIDVWAQMRFVNHRVLGEKWMAFANEYCYKSGFMGHKWEFDQTKRHRFLAKLKSHVYRLTTDFMKLKPILLHPVPFFLLGDQDRLYHQMKNHGVIQIGQTTITAPLEITNKMKREQITGGYVLDEEDNSHPTGRAKERKLRGLLRRLEPPVVVFCHFLHEIPLIRRVLRERFTRVKALHGGIRNDKKGNYRTDLLRDFQAGEVDALICQLRTGGVAVDLTRSCELVFYSINHSYIDFEQTLFRLYGMNQKKTLNAYLLFAVDTVDEEKIQVIKNKKSAAYRVVSHFEPGEK